MCYNGFKCIKMSRKASTFLVDQKYPHEHSYDRVLSSQEKQSILITTTVNFGKGDSSVVGPLGVIPLKYVHICICSISRTAGNNKIANKTTQETR